jgi:hypothetical protein
LIYNGDQICCVFIKLVMRSMLGSLNMLDKVVNYHLLVIVDNFNQNIDEVLSKCCQDSEFKICLEFEKHSKFKICLE